MTTDSQVQKYAIKRRERYVEDWELAEALQVAPPMLRAYVILKLLTGLRRGDLLRLRPTDLRDDGIHVVTHKTGTRLIIEWSPALREAVDAALQARPKHIAPWLFCTHRGQPYVKEDSFAPAFNSLWQRFMARALKQTQLEERFQEKDLRKKVGSDIDLDHARTLLGHTTAETTRRHYRLRGERVKPAK